MRPDAVVTWATPANAATANGHQGHDGVPAGLGVVFGRDAGRCRAQAPDQLFGGASARVAGVRSLASEKPGLRHVLDGLAPVGLVLEHRPGGGRF